MKDIVNGPERSVSRIFDEELHSCLMLISPVRVSAMQILVHHVEMEAGAAPSLTTKEFLSISEKFVVSQEKFVSLPEQLLKPLGLVFPDELMATYKAATKAVNELGRVVRNCHEGAQGELVGFQPVDDMYALCCTRVAGGVGSFTSQVMAFNLLVAEGEKTGSTDKTAEIVMEIGKIGRVINMVATNASIEAARAGDAGKGFNVIADEVKSLSSRVSTLTASLREQLGSA